MTTEVIIQAMQRLKDMDVPAPDAFRLFRKEMENLSIIIGTKLLPAFTPIVKFINGLLEKFSNLPAPLQTIIAAVTAASAGLVIIAPALGLIVTGIGAIGTVIGAVLPFLAPILAGGAIPLAIVGLGALIFKFRDQIGQAFAAIGQFIYAPFQPFVEFVGNIFSSAINMAHNAFGRLPAVVQNAVKAATAPLRGFIKFLKGILSLLARVRREKKEKQVVVQVVEVVVRLPQQQQEQQQVPHHQVHQVVHYHQYRLQAHYHQYHPHHQTFLFHQYHPHQLVYQAQHHLIQIFHQAHQVKKVAMECQDKI